MYSTNLKNLLLFFLAVIFSVALMFSFIELPRLADNLLRHLIGFPGFDPGNDEFSAYKTDLFIGALYLRWIGYGSLALILIFIITGYLTRKSSLMWAGAFVLFLPVFGQFALSMFFLSGLGILRSGWLPFMDISPNILKLGEVIYLPYHGFMWVGRLFNLDLHLFISWCLMTSGIFLFVWGVTVWLQNRFSSKAVAINLIYKVSRHPQYLGWIIWSYGLLLYSSRLNTMKISWEISPSLPWLLSTMIIVGICLMEEIHMLKKNGENYRRYRSKTPFLLPLPMRLNSLLGLPARFLTGKKHLESRLDVFYITGIYTMVLITVSLFLLNLNGKQNIANRAAAEIPPEEIASVVQEIRNTPGRRTLHIPFNNLIRAGDTAIPPLSEMLKDSNAVIREFSADALGKIGNIHSVKYLIPLLEDSVARVRNSAAQALGHIGSEDALPVLMRMLQDPIDPGLRSWICDALGNIGSESAWEQLVPELKDSRWWHRNMVLNALTKINTKKAMPQVIAALQDENPNVRRNAVMILLRAKPPDARSALEAVLTDEDFETRFYARQALELLKQRPPE